MAKNIKTLKSRKISKSLERTLPFFKLISKLSSRKRNMILKELGGDKIVFNSLHEIAHNIINNNIKLNKNQSRRLKTFLKTFKKICCKDIKKTTSKRKQLIQQVGGAFPLFIPPLIATLAPIIANLL